MLIAAGALTLGLLVDHWLGEPKRYHPLVGFGRCVSGLERRLNRTPQAQSAQWLGLLGVILLVLPPVMLTLLLSTLFDTLLPGLSLVLDIIVIWSAVGLRSLADHIRPIIAALKRDDEAEARRLTARICSRDPQTLQIARTAVESVLENGNDAVFGVLFWYLLAGAPGVVAYRLLNTLDAMWGYRTERYRWFGRAAAQIDDLINWIPARLCVLCYALSGNVRQGLRFAIKQGRARKSTESPNGVPVMAAGAAALNIALGGRTRYGGEWQDKGVLGTGAAPKNADIARALQLLYRGVTCFMIGTWALALVFAMV